MRAIVERAAPGSWDWPRIVYGDWTWFVRDWLDVLRLVFIGGTIVFAVQGNPDTPALAAASTVLLLARIVDLPRWFDFGLTVAMTLIAWGTALHLYGGWFYYDKVVHSLSPMAYAPVLYIALVRLGVVPDPGSAIRERSAARIAGIFIVTLAVGMAVGAGYENVEWIEDKFGILGGHFVKGLWDTETDLLADTTGSLAGATFLTVWSLRGWSSRRVTVHQVTSPDATAAQRIQTTREQSTAPWRQALNGLPTALKGAVGVVAGILLLVWPSPLVRTVEVIVGVALIARAAVDVQVLVRQGGRESPARWLEIAVEVVAAILLLGWPGMSSVALLYIVGSAAVLFAGLEAASLADTARSTHDRWLGGAVSATAFAFGVTMLATAQHAVHAAATVVGLYLLGVGVLQLVRAAQAREAHGAMRVRSAG